MSAVEFKPGIVFRYFYNQVTRGPVAVLLWLMSQSDKGTLEEALSSDDSLESKQEVGKAAFSPLSLWRVSETQVLVLIKNWRTGKPWTDNHYGFNVALQVRGPGPSFFLKAPYFPDISITWCRANEATGQISSWQLLLQNGDDLLIKVLHGHGGDVPQLLQNLVSPLRGSGGVHVAQHTVNLIYYLITHNSTQSGQWK